MIFQIYPMEDICFFHNLDTYTTTYQSLRSTKYTKFVEDFEKSKTAITDFLTKKTLLEIKEIIESIRSWHVPAADFTHFELTSSRSEMEEKIVKFYNNRGHTLIPLNKYNNLLSSFSHCDCDDDIITFLQKEDMEVVKNILSDIRTFYLPKNQYIFDTALNKTKDDFVKNIVSFYRNKQLPYEIQFNLKNKVEIS